MAWPGRGPAALVAHLRTPLYRNAYALILSTGLSSGLGFLYWVLAARRYPPADVGRGAAAIAAMLALSGLARLNLGVALIRFVPVAGRATGRLIGTVDGLTALLSVLACGAFLGVVGRWFPALGFLRATLAAALGFTLATLAWGVFTLQDDLLTSLQRAVWVPVENAAYAGAKLALLLLLAGRGDHEGLLASWDSPPWSPCRSSTSGSPGGCSRRTPGPRATTPGCPARVPSPATSPGTTWAASAPRWPRPRSRSS